jgi:hypothetical protein
MGASQVRPSAPISTALLVWENRQCDPRRHVPYVVEQDEDGIWCASAQLRTDAGTGMRRPDGRSRGRGLRDALEALLAEVGPSDELTLTLDVA